MCGSGIAGARAASVDRKFPGVVRVCTGACTITRELYMSKACSCKLGMVIKIRNGFAPRRSL